MTGRISLGSGSRLSAWCLVLWSLALQSNASAQMADFDVDIKVSKQAVDDKIVYHYRVVNNSPYPIVAFSIGHDYRRRRAELLTPPVGWTAERGVAAGSTAEPEAWMSMVVTTEKSPFVWLEWGIDAESAEGILPGRTLTGFRVVLPREAPEYERAHFDAILSNSMHVSAPVTPDEAPVIPEAMSLSVTATEDSPTPITLLSNTPKDSKVVYRITQGPAHGTLSGVAPHLVFTPNAGFVGTDSFDFMVGNGAIESDVAVVAITVNPKPGGSCLGCASASGLEWAAMLVLLLSTGRIHRNRSSP
jgi:Bacterial Ig domain